MRIRVQGGQPLNGTYHVSGNTNAAIELLAASLMTDQPVTLHNVPRTATMQLMLDIAAWLGTDVQWQDDHTLTAVTTQVAKRSLTPLETNGAVAALLFIAPVLARRGYFRLEVDFPLNRIRTHLEALRDLGQDVVVSDGAIELKAVPWEYKDILLVQPSVTATAAALMLAAVLGKETVIVNAACEPHVQELGRFLELMGAQVEGIGSSLLRVFGTETLNGATAAVGADHIEAASIAAISALCGGRVQIEGTHQPDMRMIARIFRRLGVKLDVDETTIYVPKHEQLVLSNREEDVDLTIETAPFPGFPSDLVAIATVVATQARGTSLIHEKLFPDRLLFVDKLNAMGAQIVLCDPHRAIVVGASPLRAAYMDSPDVRIGLGLLGAALVAQGESVIDNAQAVSRSFEGVLEKLAGLGAQITTEAV